MATKALDSLKLFGFDPAQPREKKKKGILEMLGIGGKAPERAQYELSRCAAVLVFSFLFLFFSPGTFRR